MQACRLDVQGQVLPGQKSQRVGNRPNNKSQELGRLANGDYVNGGFEFQCAQEMHSFQRIGRSPVFVRAVQPFFSLSLPWWGLLARILKALVCKVPVDELMKIVHAIRATGGCKSPCPSGGGVHNIVLGDPLF